MAQLVKNTPANAREEGSVLGGEDPLEKEMASYSSHLAWRIPMDRGAWQATVHGASKSQTQVSAHACAHTHMIF